MALELNRVVAEILARAAKARPPVVIAAPILAAAQLEVKDFLAGSMSDADAETIGEALVDARKQLTGVTVASGEPVPPLALTEAMLDLAALDPPIAVPPDVIDAAKQEQALALANGTPPTPLQREALARAYEKAEGLLPEAAKTGKALAATPPKAAPAAPVAKPVTEPVVARAVAQARTANLTIQPAWEAAAATETTLITSASVPTPAQQASMNEALASIKAALPK